MPVGGSMARTSTRAPSPTRLEATAWPAGPGRGAGGRRQGLVKQRVNAPSNISDLAPLVWRAPEGPEGTGGLRDRPLRAFRLACGDLAGGRGLRRPEHPRGHKQQHAGTNGEWAGRPGGARKSGGARNTSSATQRQHAAPTASGRAAAHRHTQRPGPSRQATRRPEHPWVHKQRRRSGGSASGTATTGGRKAYSPRNALIAGISRTACTRPAR